MLAAATTTITTREKWDRDLQGVITDQYFADPYHQNEVVGIYNNTERTSSYSFTLFKEEHFRVVQYEPT